MNYAAAADTLSCPVIELRQYTLKPGQRDTLIDLFDRHFVESQEAVGMTIIGQFRDRERPNRFVWMRGFRDMASRHRALEQFYNGPIWAAHRAAANSTMLDWDDVRLLRPARQDMSFTMERDSTGGRHAPTDVLVGVYVLNQPADDMLVARFERDIAPQLRAHGVKVEGVFVTETASNTFTELPVREGEHVFVWVASVAGTQSSPQRVEDPAILDALTLSGAPSTLLRLEPTSRSWLGHGPQARRSTMQDFDFLHGSWNVRNRYLKHRLKRSTEWVEFDARSDVEPVLNGFGQIDRYRALRDGSPVEGLTLRLFNPATGEWSLHWVDTVRTGVLLPPMVGRFASEVGEFLGEETADGKKVLCRFRWTAQGGTPRWEQAFSDDGGQTWETNWIMTFTHR